MGFKIAIVGGAASSRMTAPFENQAWEIWTCNNCFIGLPRLNRIFELHKIHCRGTEYFRRGKKEFRGMVVRDYLKELASTSVPIYMQFCWPIIPQSISYPLETIIERFGRYFTSSIAYMLALAIREGATDISLHGINMGCDDEYQTQKPCIEYLIGYAKGMGIRVSIPEDSMLLHAKEMYGYEETLLPDPKELVKRFQIQK